MQKQSSKSESTRKTEQNRFCWKILTMVKVNGQRSKSTLRVNGQRLTCVDVAVWRHLGLTWQEEKQQQARVARECAWLARVGHVAGTSGAWRRVLVRQKLQEARGGACDAVSGRSWLAKPGLVVLSFYAFYLAVECAERWYPSVAGTVGVTAVARFWQWWLDEGEGSGRTPKMSIGTKKSEERLWYHVNNIRWEKKTE